MSDFVACPCCRYATLNARADFEICTICWWEDDGQDDYNANDVLGGPNGIYSLRKARENFADHFDMYDTGNGIGVVADPSPERKLLIAYLRSSSEGASLDERRLHGLLRSDSDARRKAQQ